MPKTLIIAATSARGYAQAAAVCGYEVIALDAFIDAETRAVCKQSYQLKLNDSDNSFCLDETHFKQVFSKIDLTDIDGFLVGSVFDACPHLLAWVAEQVPVLGNSADVLSQVKAFSFFALLDSLNIAHPEVSLCEKISQPSFPRRRESNLTLNVEKTKMDSRLRGNDEISEDWLCKQIGGSGGMHIQPANLTSQYLAKAGDYFQRKIDGKPISMLFVADGKAAKLIGFNQLLVAPTKEIPYRFAGAVGSVALQPNTHAAFEHAALMLTQALRLRGICSLDAVLENEGQDGEKLWVLELNPRLSATFHLYENLLPLHLQGCAGNLAVFEQQENISNAQFIVYADEPLEITKNFEWPNWCADIPALDVGVSSVRISKNAPICSVLAQAENATAAHALVMQRAEQLRELLN